MHFCLAGYVFIQLRFCQRIHLAPFLWWINVNTKPKTKLSALVQKGISVNGPQILVKYFGPKHITNSQEPERAPV